MAWNNYKHFLTRNKTLLVCINSKNTLSPRKQCQWTNHRHAYVWTASPGDWEGTAELLVQQICTLPESTLMVAPGMCRQETAEAPPAAAVAARLCHVVLLGHMELKVNQLPRKWTGSAPESPFPSLTAPSCPSCSELGRQGQGQCVLPTPPCPSESGDHALVPQRWGNAWDKRGRDTVMLFGLLYQSLYWPPNVRENDISRKRELLGSNQLQICPFRML